MASQMITGTSGYVNGSKFIGTMPYVTGDASGQYPATQLSVGAYSGDGQTYAYMGVPTGNYLNSVSWIKSLQQDLIPQNIISGKNIFGIGGSATISSLGGKTIISGTQAITQVLSGSTVINQVIYVPDMTTSPYSVCLFIPAGNYYYRVKIYVNGYYATLYSITPDGSNFVWYHDNFATNNYSVNNPVVIDVANRQLRVKVTDTSAVGQTITWQVAI
jgi:hypothetical protein